jgi:transposase
VEYSANCQRERRVEIDGAPHLAGFWLTAAPPKTFLALQRSIFCRKSTRYCRAVFESAGRCRSFVFGGKSQIQALERTQPMLPMGLGYVQGVTHDYRRHGTTTLFAALDTANGQVITQCRRRHRHQEYLDFLRAIDQNVPTTLQVHIIVDNYATHKHPRVQRWLAARPRFHVHFTPTYASWFNQVEICSTASPSRRFVAEHLAV